LFWAKSHDIGGVQDTRGVFNPGGKQNAGEGGMKGYILPSYFQFLVELVMMVYGPNRVQS
jgi:hypothetical protein